jgi:hypothetical protein
MPCLSSGHQDRRWSWEPLGMSSWRCAEMGKLFAVRLFSRMLDSCGVIESSCEAFYRRRRRGFEVSGRHQGLRVQEEEEEAEAMIGRNNLPPQFRGQTILRSRQVQTSSNLNPSYFLHNHIRSPRQYPPERQRTSSRPPFRGKHLRTLTTKYPKYRAGL